MLRLPGHRGHPPSCSPTTRPAPRCHALERGDRDEALATALDVSRTEAAELARAAGAAALTYREAIAVLAPDAEGTYFLHRFSDPTFVSAEALVRVLGGVAPAGGPWLDLCGGTGHLAHALAGAEEEPGPARAETVIADLYFWKLWLATHITTPAAGAVCCSADAPLPFTSDRFSMVVLMDAFPYIWHKRLCADEMMRVARPDGVVALPHLHSSEGENYAAGDPLSPSAYRDLFAPFRPALLSDARLLDGLLDDACLDLADDRSPEQLHGEPSLTLVASRQAGARRRASAPEPAAVAGALRVNPLYAGRGPGRPLGADPAVPHPRVRRGVRPLSALSAGTGGRGRGPERPDRSAAARAALRGAETAAGGPRPAPALPVASARPTAGLT